MSEKQIIAKSGTYGRINVTLPIQVKEAMLKWAGNSGIKKAEFFRLALMIGVADLSNKINAKNSEDGFREDDVMQASARP